MNQRFADKLRVKRLSTKACFAIDCRQSPYYAEDMSALTSRCAERREPKVKFSDNDWIKKDYLDGVLNEGHYYTLTTQRAALGDEEQINDCTVMQVVTKNMTKKALPFKNVWRDFTLPMYVQFGLQTFRA